MEYENSKMDSGYSNMISADYSAMANLPQEVIMKAYPKCSYLGDSGLDDTMSGLDSNRSFGVGQMTKYKSKTKY